MNNRRRTLLSGGGDGIDPSQAAPLEVAFYNGSKIVIREQSEWKDGETPIGIVVVPGYHNRYGDGSCGVMSLQILDQTGVEAPQAFRCAFPVLGSDSVDHQIFGSNLNSNRKTRYGACCWSKGTDNDLGCFKSTTAITSGTKTVCIPC
jgi:hypothetical protein